MKISDEQRVEEIRQLMASKYRRSCGHAAQGAIDDLLALVAMQKCELIAARRVVETGQRYIDWSQGDGPAEAGNSAIRALTKALTAYDAVVNQPLKESQRE